MLIVGISGSPRKNGNSEQIIQMMKDYFFEEDFEVITLKLSEVSAAPCRHCNYCRNANECSQDAAANEVNRILVQADAIIVATPVYFGGMTGQLKCLLDKTVPLRRNGYLLSGKIGAAIATAMDRNGGQESAVKAVHAWMLTHGMAVVGDKVNFGASVVEPVQADETGLQAIQETFLAVKRMLRRIRPQQDKS